MMAFFDPDSLEPAQTKGLILPRIGANGRIFTQPETTGGLCLAAGHVHKPQDLRFFGFQIKLVFFGLQIHRLNNRLS